MPPPRFTRAERKAIADYERYVRAVATIFDRTRSGPPLKEMPPFPDLDALNAAVRKGYVMRLGPPERYVFDP
jgi:hypothetical protein